MKTQLNYQMDLLGPARPAFSTAQIVDYYARDVKFAGDYDEWRKEVLLRCSVHGPIFDSVVDRIAKMSKQKQGEQLRVHARECYVSGYLLYEGWHFGTLDRQLRNWQKENQFPPESLKATKGEVYAPPKRTF